MKRIILITVGLALVSVMVIGAVALPSRQKKTHLNDRASCLVAFYAAVPADSDQPLWLIRPDGTFDEDYTLPPDTLLVVTDLLVTFNNAFGYARGGLMNSSLTGGVSPYFTITGNTDVLQAIHLTSGAVWSEIPRAYNFQDSTSGVFVHVYGYLVKDR